MKSRRPKKSKDFKRVTLFGDFGAPSWGAKIVHFAENRLQEASWKRFEAILKRDRQKSPYRSLLGALFARFAGDVARDVLFTALRGCRYLEGELALEIQLCCMLGVV